MIKRFLLSTLFLFLLISLTTTSCSSDDSGKAIIETPVIITPGPEPGPGPGPDPGPNPNPTPTGIENFQHRVLLTDFTGKTCNPCARVIKALDQLEKLNTDKGVVVLAIHMNIPGPDPMTVNSIANPLFNHFMTKFNVAPSDRGIPYAVINNKEEWKFPENKNLNQPLDLVEDSSPIGIKINSTLAETEGTISVEIAFSQDYAEGIKYIAYVVEDGIKDSQAGIGANFLHNAVAKAITGTTPLGAQIESTSTKKGSIFKAEGLAVKYKAANVENLRVMVIAMDKDNNVLNVQDAKANTEKHYVIIK